MLAIYLRHDDHGSHSMFSHLSVHFEHSGSSRYHFSVIDSDVGRKENETCHIRKFYYSGSCVSTVNYSLMSVQSINLNSYNYVIIGLV